MVKYYRFAERVEKEEVKLNLIPHYHNGELATEDLYKINKLNTFFNRFDQRRNIYFTIQELIEFIRRYEELSFGKASKLKTERGQRNNYQRSLDDLN